jgi:hypothetical protein
VCLASTVSALAVVDLSRGSLTPRDLLRLHPQPAASTANRPRKLSVSRKHLHAQFPSSRDLARRRQCSLWIAREALSDASIGQAVTCRLTIKVVIFGATGMVGNQLSA